MHVFPGFGIPISIISPFEVGERNMNGHCLMSLMYKKFDQCYLI